MSDATFIHLPQISVSERLCALECLMLGKDLKKAQRESMAQTEPTGPAPPRMQQLLHGLRLSASDDLSPASDLDCLARLIENRRYQPQRRRA